MRFGQNNALPRLAVCQGSDGEQKQSAVQYIHAYAGWEKAKHVSETNLQQQDGKSSQDADDFTHQPQVVLVCHITLLREQAKMCWICVFRHIPLIDRVSHAGAHFDIYRCTVRAKEMLFFCSFFNSIGTTL